MNNITTTYKTGPNGKGQILAKGGGKQRTLPYDHSESVDRNHGAAAGELARVLGWHEADALTHIIKHGKHIFSRL